MANSSSPSLRSGYALLKIFMQKAALRKLLFKY